MSITNDSGATENSDSVNSDSTENDQSNESTASCIYWNREDGRKFITDPNGEIVNLSRLTAYARYGDEIYDAHVHHELAHPEVKIDAPAFLSPLSPAEHGRLHGQDPDPVEVEGIPRLRAER